jgi:hypothetical protein
MGRKVATVVDGQQPPGTSVAVWDGRDRNGRDAASGIYFFRFRAAGFEDTKSMIMLR